MKYFPDTFVNRTPPSEYFWKVYSVIRRHEFRVMMEEKLSQFKGKSKSIDTHLTLTDEALRIFNKTDFSANLDLLRDLSSSEI